MARRRRSRGRLAALVAVAAGACVALWLSAGGSARGVVRAALDRTAIRRVEALAEPILRASQESGVDPCLLAAIALAESSGRVDARSHKEALGLFQLRMPTARERAVVLGLPEPTEEALLSDPLLNARLGADYLAWLLDRQRGDVERALIAYNAGPGRLAAWIEEAGDYATWRARRVAAGDSGVLAYAAKVERYRRVFRERGRFASPPAPGG